MLNKINPFSKKLEVNETIPSEFDEIELPPVRNPMPLLDRLERCKSRAAARETIEDYCADIGIDPKDLKLGREHLHILQHLH